MEKEKSNISNNDVVINILEEKKYLDECVEMPTIKRVQYKRQSMPIRVTQQPVVKRRTKSFPIESSSRKGSSRMPSQKTTPEKHPNKKIHANPLPKKKKAFITLEKKDDDEKFKETIEDTDQVNWDLGCFKIPKDCLVYITQMSIITTVIGISLYNISTNSDRQEFWASLLSGSVGYILPQPTLKTKINK